MVRVVQVLARNEMVHINVLDEAHDRHVRGLMSSAGVDDSRIVCYRFPTNDAWCRDHGAIFVTRSGEYGGELGGIDCRFNSWGGKYPPWDLDDAIARHMATALNVPRFEADMILEGGSVEVNGAGVLLTTEQCLLNPNRNPAMSRTDIERRLMRLLGVRQIVWLGDGIVGDDTDGHIDDLTRFVDGCTVVTAIEQDPADDNYSPLQENLARLRAVRLADGSPLRIVELPMPEPVLFEGERLPASYANFYIANRAVLLPKFDCPQDAIACDVMSRCFPDREIVPVDCRMLVRGLGAIHCLTQQVPEPSGPWSAEE